MTRVIGLFSREDDYNRSLVDLRAAGFQPEMIGLASREQFVGDLMGRGSGRIIAMYAGGGALLGLGIYGIFALLASWCQCNLFQYGQIVQLETFVGGVLAGMLVGGSLGVFLGVGKLEEVSSIFGQGRRMNGRLLNVSVSGEQAERVKNLLQRDGAAEVKILTGK